MKPGRPKLARKWKHPESRRLIAKAELELYRASVNLREAKTLTELAAAELEADRGLHRLKSVMAAEENIRRLDR